MDRSSLRSSQRFHVSSQNNLAAEPDAIFQIATSSAARYISDSSTDNTSRLDESLNSLIRHVADVDRATRLTLKNRYIREFLAHSPVILNASTTNIVTRSKFYRFLFSVAHHNIPIRRFMAGELRLLGAVFSCLKASLKEQLGPQNMIDILRLLQVLSYEKNVPLEHWANELISFLMQEVIREPEPEWMPYCIAILCNLASASKSACKRIKISTSYKKFSRQLMKLLQHNARIIVVSSLVLIGYLDEKVRDMVYCTENVHDTFMCTFNVLTIGDDDCMMTRQIAADLLKRLVVSESPGVPTLATTGKNVLNYGFFIGSIQQTAKLLITLDPRTEESSKIYDLLLAFCSLQQLRSPVCQAIIRCSPTEAQLTTPLLAVLETAGSGFSQKALKLLCHLLKECIEPTEQLAPELGIPISQIVELISDCTARNFDHLPTIENSEFLEKLERLQVGLRLAEVAAHDEQIRRHLLSTCPAHFCQQLATWQFSQNPIVGYLTKPQKERTEQLEEYWTEFGIGIILELCRLLAVLKDHSKVHKDQYWQLLKDERIIPFLAYGISYGDQDTVQQAFLTYSHCTQLAAFPSHLLAEMVASCKTPPTSKSTSSDSPELRPRRDSDRPLSQSGEIMFTDERTTAAAPNAQIAALERKVANLQLRERDLEEKLRNSHGISHNANLMEIEKLREQNQKLAERGNLEVEKLGAELSEVKLRCETIETSFGTCIQEKAALKAQLSDSIINCEKLQSEVSTLNRELAQNIARIEILISESKDTKIEYEEKIVECEVLKEHIIQIDGELKIKQADLDRSMQKTSVIEQRLAAKEAELAEAEKHMKLYESRLSDRERDLQSSRAESDRLKMEIESMRRNLQKLENMREAMLSLASASTN